MAFLSQRSSWLPCLRIRPELRWEKGSFALRNAREPSVTGLLANLISHHPPVAGSTWITLFSLITTCTKHDTKKPPFIFTFAMLSLKTTVLALLAATATAMPATVRLTPRQMQYHTLAKRQQEEAAAAGLSDFDILQFALTLENLEESFYRQGFAKFPASDFAALGLDEQAISDLQQIGKTEAEHVGLLQSSLAQGGVQPVQACEYEFGFTDAAAMVQTAAVLENIGVSAYLGAAPLLSDKAILGTAGSILTIEARHQSAIRVFSKQVAVPQAFDAPLGPRAVFSLAAPFIKSCPEGSNLKIEAFPKLAMEPGSATEGAGGNGTRSAAGESGGKSGVLSVGSNFRVQADAATSAGATNCAFTSGGVFPGGTAFSKFSQTEGCQVPQGVAGITYVTLTKGAPLTGAISDDLIVAGPMAVVVS
ncbi:Ferritin/ribonucleotide reductase-like protein [Cordyceps militaris CM01]|uniref:Ferritin/ribonucleotide reductase-like protein n=1 Tax=Cordyceps militaris (strain CM01) TaxID=983644 RepID=G3J9G7_CORMM|nr:Ferritin/ribonucleotide reductase-like protein [Cordyceps militaris CM01]EGX94944.1 Ferritin/ribonucleotide reductase-like protein [Cordyceps militaris CM01]